MKRLLALFLAMLLLASSLLVSCKDNDKKPNEDTTKKVEETTKKDEKDKKDTTSDETTEEDTTDGETAPDTTAGTEAQTTNIQPPAQTGQTQTNSDSSSSSGIGLGEGNIVWSEGGGNGSSGGIVQTPDGVTGTAAWDLTTPISSDSMDAYPTTLITKSGKKLVHTYSDRAIGYEDNSENLPYMPMLSSTVYHDPYGAYNSGRVLLKDIKPGLVSDGVIVGYDGYMFYGDTVDDFQGQGFLHDQIYNRAVQMLRERNSWAEQHGKKFYFVIAPNKNTVYPDYMPEGYTMASYRRYDQFVQIIQSAGITAVDLRETMNAAVKADPQRNLYYKYDTHWNNHAGFLAYQTTMNMIRKDFPNAIMHQKDEYQINYCETYMKDQAYYLGYYDYFKDYGPVYTLKSGKTATLTKYEPRTSWGQFAFAYECTSGPNTGFSDKLYWLQYTNDYNSSAPDIYVMRDSYSIAMIPFLKDSFHMSTYNWTFSFSQEEIENAKADIILVIVAERNLKSYVNSTPVTD